MYTLLIVLEVLISILLVTSILLQPSKADGFKGFITGNSETFFSRNKSRTREAFLEKLTIILAVLFAVVTILLNLLKQ